MYFSRDCFAGIISSYFTSSDSCFNSHQRSYLIFTLLLPVEDQKENLTSPSDECCTSAFLSWRSDSFLSSYQTRDL